MCVQYPPGDRSSFMQGGEKQEIQGKALWARCQAANVRISPTQLSEPNSLTATTTRTTAELGPPQLRRQRFAMFVGAWLEIAPTFLLLVFVCWYRNIFQ